MIPYKEGDDVLWRSVFSAAPTTPLTSDLWTLFILGMGIKGFPSG